MAIRARVVRDHMARDISEQYRRGMWRVITKSFYCADYGSRGLPPGSRGPEVTIRPCELPGWNLRPA